MNQPPAQTHDIAKRAFAKHLAMHPLTHYTGILSLHGLARLAVISGEAQMLDEARSHLRPFVRGEHQFACNFKNYLCGGNGTAFLLQQSVFPEAADSVRFYAEQTMRKAPRDENGILCMPWDKARQKIFIDVTFAVTPFLLFAGLALDNEDYIEDAFQQTAKMIEIFRDAKNGLLHQSRGFAGPDKLSQDHWSRGNGWGIFALTELINYLPQHHARRAASEALFIDLINACLRVQDTDGMWHQELTNHNSYVETSGSGLILYAIGVGLKKGLLPDTAREKYINGLREYLKYITPDDDVFHTCRGCLCPGDGSQLAYEAQSPLLNDCHAFGPVILAFGQAWNLGIKEL